ncbi:hypothetical protein MASR2M48_31680 [Spirochaetota bacterium]
MRRFWRGDSGSVAAMATRLTGSSDLYLRDGRKPFHSINYITSHDGFTLRDLVSFNGKHNEANGERGMDGHDSNFSFNHGYEGPKYRSRHSRPERTTAEEFPRYPSPFNRHSHAAWRRRVWPDTERQ